MLHSESPLCQEHGCPEHSYNPATIHNCAGLDMLIENKYIVVETIINLFSGQESHEPVLREIKEGKSGKLVIGRNWCKISFCPACGEKMYPSPKDGLPHIRDTDAPCEGIQGLST